MKQPTRFVVLFFGMAILLASCQKAPELTVISPASIDLSVDGSSGTITFSANRDWSVSTSDSWISVSPSSGKASDGPVTVSVRCNANTTYDDRTATVTIRMEDLSQTVTVRQPANLGVILPKQLFDLQSDANSIDVEVQANVQYTVSSSVDWIKQTGTKGLTSKTLTFSIEENKTYDPREGKITIKPQGCVQEQVISVKQAQKDALNVEKTSYDMPYGGGEIEIKVETNVSFDVTPNADWIHYTQTKALSNSTVSLKIDENATYSPRQGTIEIKQQNGSLKHTITVIQAGRVAVAAIELDQSSLTLTMPGGTAKLVATVKPDNATDKIVDWSSSDSAIASVDDTGNVTAIKEGSAIITAKTGEKSATCSVVVYQINSPSAVDLGLRVKWATFNIGASAPEEAGFFYAWGETETKSYFSCENYKWGNGASIANFKYTKYGLISKPDDRWEGSGTPDGKTVLDPEDDVAHVKLGGKWRMPTNAEWTELRSNCTWTWTSQNGVYGALVTSKKNSNSIFLPAAGMQIEANVVEGSTGNYWSSSLSMESTGWAMGIYFNFSYSSWLSSPYISSSNSIRTFGQSVRPVTE